MSGARRVAEHEAIGLPNVKLSVVIVTWNVAQKVAACLESLQAALAQIPHEVMLVDNASTDGTTAMVKARFPGVQVMSNPDNLGYAAANNQAIERARGEFILLLNPDTIVLPDALSAMLRTMDADAGIGIASPMLVSAQGAQELTGGMRYPGMRRPAAKPVPGAAGPVRELAYVIGAAMMIRREVLDRIGGLDPRFYMFYEDIDLCKRARDAGWRVVVVESVCIVHDRGSSSRQLTTEAQARLYVTSELRFHRKHYSRVKALRLQAARWFGTVWCLCWYGTLGRVFAKESALKFSKHKGRLRALLGI